MRLVKSAQAGRLGSRQSQVKSGQARPSSESCSAHRRPTTLNVAWGRPGGLPTALSPCGLPCSLQVGLARGRWAPPSVPRAVCGGRGGDCGRTGQSPTPHCWEPGSLPHWCAGQLLATFFTVTVTVTVNRRPPGSSTTRDCLRFRLFRATWLSSDFPLISRGWQAGRLVMDLLIIALLLQPSRTHRTIRKPLTVND